MECLRLLVFYIHLTKTVIVVTISFSQQQELCWWDIFKSERKCRPLCDRGYFGLHGMKTCHKWLTCRDMSDVVIGPELGAGAVKMVTLASWHNFPVVVNRLRHESYKDDFQHGLDMIKLYQPNLRVIQLVGFCREKNLYLTEYHHLGSADSVETIMNSLQSNLKAEGDSNSIQQLDSSETDRFIVPSMQLYKENNLGKNGFLENVCLVLESPAMQQLGFSNQCPVIKKSKQLCKTDREEEIFSFDVSKHIPEIDKKFHSLKIRFQLCLDYISILVILHNGPGGTRIMCDSNDVEKTLSQYLLTDELRLIVNDLDALPYVRSSAGITAKCGHKEISGDFVAPEQLWPFEDREFQDEEMPGYDEKTDVWKIPEICNTFLGSVDGSTNLKLYLFNINNKCKDDDPRKRPSSEKVFNEYINIWDKVRSV